MFLCISIFAIEIGCFERLLCVFLALASLAAEGIVACVDESSFVSSSRFNGRAESRACTTSSFFEDTFGVARREV